MTQQSSFIFQYFEKTSTISYHYVFPPAKQKTCKNKAFLPLPPRKNLEKTQTWSYFEPKWTPDSWTRRFRILIIRQKKKKPTKGELQLDLFEPVSHEYEYSVIVTNKTTGARHVLEFHHGRGSQEGIFAEGKSQCQLGYIPVRKKTGNQIYCLSAMLAHNLTRELQMQAAPRSETATAKRRPLWVFESLKTIRHRLVRRAGRLLFPQGRFTLSLGANKTVQRDFEPGLFMNHRCDRPKTPVFL